MVVKCVRSSTMQPIRLASAGSTRCRHGPITANGLTDGQADGQQLLQTADLLAEPRRALSWALLRADGQADGQQQLQTADASWALLRADGLGDQTGSQKQSPPTTTHSKWASAVEAGTCSQGRIPAARGLWHVHPSRKRTSNVTVEATNHSARQPAAARAQILLRDCHPVTSS